jgi:hypothetical protein
MNPPPESSRHPAATPADVTAIAAEASAPSRRTLLRATAAAGASIGLVAASRPGGAVAAGRPAGDAGRGRDRAPKPPPFSGT